MKRIFAFGLFLTMLLGFGFHAQAQDEEEPKLTLDIEWNITNGIGKVYVGGTGDSNLQDLPANSDSFVAKNYKTYGSCYIYPNPKYLIESAQIEDVQMGGDSNFRLVPNSSGPDYICLDMKSYNGKKLEITLKEIERTTPFSINIINGLTSITKAEFESGYTLDLKTGDNDYYYNPEIDRKLTLQFALDTDEESTYTKKPYLDPYIFTLDGVGPDPNFDSSAPLYRSGNSDLGLSWNNDYYVTLSSGSHIEIQMYKSADQELKVYNLDIAYGEGMEGCVSSIMNRGTNVMYEPKDYEGGVITGLDEVVENTELLINMGSEDFTITKVLVNGVDETMKLVSASDGIYQSFTLTMTENTTLTIEGRNTVWADITYTGYVSDPEGVMFGLGMENYNLNYTVVGDVGGRTYGVLTMPEGSKEINITVSQKNNGGRGTFYFKPKEGNFISLCYYGTPNDSETSGTRSVNAGMGYQEDGLSFYMVVDKMDPAYTANMNVHVSGYPDVTYLKGSTTYSGQNDNPAEKKIQLESGESVVTFIPNYDNPFTLSLNQNQSGRIFLDGAEVTGAANSDTNQTDYTLDLYAPAAGETSDIHSDIQVYFSGAPTMATATLNLENNATAEFFYSPVMRAAQESQAVIAGTVMTVKPTSTNAVVIYKGEVQDLNENGEFQFTTSTTAADNTVTVTGPKIIKIAGMTPANGSSVKSFNQVDLILPALENEENVLSPNEAILGQAVVTFNGEDVATLDELGEMYGNEDGQMILPLIFNKTLTDDGRYYIKVPQGAFEECACEATEGFVPVPGGYITDLFSGNLKVDSSLKSAIETYTLSPEDGSTVGEIAEISLVFPQYSYYTQAKDAEGGYEWENAATFTNGETTVDAILTIDEDYAGTDLAFVVKVKTPITEPGKWTLKIAEGSIVVDDETSPEITAKYTIEAQVSGYEVSPENGATVEKLSEITITFPGVEEVEYNDEVAITLEGPDGYSASSTDVHGTGNVWTVSFRNPSAEGEYTVTFPAGAFTLDGEASKEEVASYIYKQIWKLSPEPGNTLTSLNELTLSFPEATEVEYVGSGYMFALSKGQVYSTPSMNCEKVEDASVPTFKITLIEGAQTPPNGLITFSVEEGAFEIDGKESPEIRVEYTLDAPVSTEYQVTPEGTIVISEYGIDFAFLFDETATVIAPAKADVTVTINDEPFTSFEMMAEGNMLMFGIYQAELPEGTLKVTIPAGAFKIGKEESPAISQEWNLVAAKVFEPEISFAGEAEGNSVSDLGKIYITFPDATSGEVWNPYGSFASLKKNDYSYFQNGTVELVENETRATGVTFSITFDPAPTEDGDYTLAVREGTFILDGVYSSPEIDHIFMLDSTMTGIESIFADENGNVTVYTLDGRVILNNVPAAQLRELEKGMYIINGKKTLVK